MIPLVAVKVAASVVVLGDVAWLADDTSPVTDPISAFLPYLNLGVIVILVIMAATKKGFIPVWTLNDAQKAAAQATVELVKAHDAAIAAMTARAEAAEAREEEYKRLNADLQNYQRDQLQPALIETTRVVSQYVQALARRGDV